MTDETPPFVVISLGGGEEQRTHHPYGSPLWQLQEMHDALGRYVQTMGRALYQFDNACGRSLHATHVNNALFDGGIVGVYVALGVAGKIAEPLLPGTGAMADGVLGLSAFMGVKAAATQAATALDYKHSDRALLHGMRIVMEEDPDADLERRNFTAMGQLYARSAPVTLLPFGRGLFFRHALRKVVRAEVAGRTATPAADMPEPGEG